MSKTNTYQKSHNIIDYATMLLLSIFAILAAKDIPYTFIAFTILYALSVVVFVVTSIKSKIYKESVIAFVFDLYVKLNLFAGPFFFCRNYPGKVEVEIYCSIVVIAYLIYDILKKKIPLYRPISYLLVHAITMCFVIL